MSLTLKLIGAVCAVTLVATAAEAKTFKIATNVSEESTAGEMIAEFAKTVAEKTEGRVTFKVFANSVLGDQLDYFQQIQKGVIDAGLVNSGVLENVIPAYGVVNLPYMFRTSEEYQTVMTSPEVRAALFESSAQHNFAPLGFLSSGFRSIYTVKPVQSAADLKGLKLRSINSPTYLEMLQLFGAVPTPLAFGELYAGLQQGVVDGAEGGLAGLYSAKFGEVAKYALRTEQTRLTDFLLTSDKFQKGLTPEDLKTVNDVFADISRRSVEKADSDDVRDLQKAIDQLGVTVVDIDKAPLIAAVEPMYQAAKADPAKAPLIEAIFKLEGRSL
ncbi:TRAP transporter substrate-binding protein DctP [Pleomorphomonas carboxyditropha]|nr:TRAP transporter substrate-binding protein DctP [Pleomorphomonas carboxyditropha]